MSMHKPFCSEINLLIDILWCCGLLITESSHQVNENMGFHCRCSGMCCGLLMTEKSQRVDENLGFC